MKITGWLAPTGEFIQCHLWRHIETVKSNPIFIEKVPKIDKILKDLDEMEESCRETADREGASNAEWHCYEIMEDKARPEIWRLLLNYGFIRVGEVDGNLHFEGRPNHLKDKYQMCKDFADSYGAGAIFEPQK